MELATALIWTLRIVLPIILFCVYFKLQAPKDEQFPGTAKHCISRGKILARREVTEVPESLQTLTLKDQTQAPQLFTPTSRQLRGAPRREDRPQRFERRDKNRDFKARAAEKEAARVREKEAAAATAAELPPAVAEADAAAAAAAAAASEEDKTNLESLLNYVAFNRKEPQRTFLLDEAAPPPPPPKPRRPPAGTPAPAGAADANAAADAAAQQSQAEAARKANADAQSVLRGAIDFRRADVAKDIYERLMDTKVEITERTFTLMIEASVLTKDLKSASDFLMKMETSGYCPDAELLDKVMDLYARQKQQREQEKSAERAAEAQAPAEPTAPGGAALATPAAEMSMPDEIFNLPRAKLSADARIFVPTFGIPPPPPPPAAPAPAAAPPPPPPPGPEVGGPAGPLGLGVATPQRTRLTAAAKPFEPQFNYTFDSYTYTWTPGVNWAEDAQNDHQAEQKGGKGHGKGHGKGGWAEGGGDHKAQAASQSKSKKPQAVKDAKGTAAEKAADAEQDAKKGGTDKSKGSPKSWKIKAVTLGEPDE